VSFLGSSGRALAKDPEFKPKKRKKNKKECIFSRMKDKGKQLWKMIIKGCNIYECYMTQYLLSAYFIFPRAL
jgi:hypothetical protein